MTAPHAACFPPAGEDGEDGAAGAADDPAFYQRREGESSRQYAERVFRQGRRCRRCLLPLACCLACLTEPAY